VTSARYQKLIKVIKNSITRKTIAVKNSGLQPVSFSLDKQLLANTGFSIEPEKVKGLPEGETVELQVVFNAKNSDPSVQFELPIHVVGGPYITISVKVMVALPELNITDGQSIDFGEVLTGFRKCITTEIQNTSNVPCEWTSKYGENDRETKYAKRNYVSSKDFEFIPSHGILGPLESIKLTIRFSPTESKIYDSIMPLRVIMTHKNYGLRLSGKGVKPSIKFTPLELLPGVVTPFADGVECRVTVENQIQYPIEIYSVENDAQYIEEEEILRNLEGYQESALLLPPRKVGVCMADYFLENKIVSSKLTEVVDEIANAFNPYTVGELVDTKATKYHNLESKQKESLDGRIIQEISTSVSVIFHGPPLSGRTCQAKKVATKFEKFYLNLDELLESACRKKQETADSQLNSGDSSNSNRLHKDDEDNSAENIYTEDFLVGALRNKFSKLECKKGVVLDGLESKYYNNAVNLTRTVMKVFVEKSKKVILFNFSLDLHKIRERESHQLKCAERKELDSLFIKELTEEEYDVLDELQRVTYDKRIKLFKRKTKEIEEKRRIRRNFEEGSLLNRTGEKAGAGKNEPKAGKQPKIVGKAAPEKDKAGAKTDVKTKPKVTGKNAAEKPEKATTEKEKGEKTFERDDDESPKLLEETFANEVLFRRAEAYFSNIEATLVSAKESERVQKLTSVQGEKKMKQNKGQPECVPGEENEECSIEIQELNVNALDEDNLFRAIIELVPTIVAEEEIQIQTSTETTLEQIYAYPAQRVRPVPSKVFILSPVNEMNEELKPSTEATVIAPPVVIAPPIVPVVIPAPNKLESKADGKDAKKGKQAAKVVEEKPVEVEEEPEKEIPIKYRWTLEPFEKKELIVKFAPTEVGITKTKLKFEITGSNAQFELPCIGNCQYPQIVTDYKKMFTKFRRPKDEVSTVYSGEYIHGTKTYDFGPLLSSKSRDKYLEKYLENMVSSTNS
jgi:hydrocephalus-inducing protein